MTLKIENLSKRYTTRDGQVAALDNISLTIDSKEFVAVMGPSGCGKTTLLLTAGGLQAPDAGTAVVAGEDLYALSAETRARHRARRIGFVFQQFHLVPYLDVLDNVLAPSLAIDIPDAKERAWGLVDRFGLTQRASHVPSRLSTGERQRTALARALLANPALILADEPTGNLDRENADVVLGHLKTFVDEGGAVLLVTHDPQAASHAHRIVQLQSGKVCVPSERD